jgi:hypothetical protein
MLHKTIKTTYSVDIAIPNSHNLHSTITEKLQKYTDLKEKLIRTWQLTTACVIPLVKGKGHPRTGHEGPEGE